MGRGRRGRIITMIQITLITTMILIIMIITTIASATTITRIITETLIDKHTTKKAERRKREGEGGSQRQRRGRVAHLPGQNT